MEELLHGEDVRVHVRDFLQLKPPKQLSLADDLVAKARQGKVVSVEAQTACEAFRGVSAVIELLETKKFQDKVLPKVMSFISEAHVFRLLSMYVARGRFRNRPPKLHKHIS